MKTTLSISLNGIQYSLEEGAYRRLKEYLDNAEQKLSSNPDKDEVIRDLEQAIAQKCDAYLNSYKNVVLESEIEKVITEMGPVEEPSAHDTDAEKKAESASSAHSVKRLYLIKDGAVLFGVCTGLAAYFDIDVTVVRIGFVIASFLSFGAVAVAYIIMAIIIPKAKTDAELAEARGLPFNAQDIVDRARAHYDEFKKKGWHRTEDSHWARTMIKAERKAWKEKARAERMYWRHKHDHSSFGDTIIGIFWLAVFYFFFRYLFLHVPAIHDLLHNIGMVISNFIEKLAQKIH